MRRGISGLCTLLVLAGLAALIPALAGAADGDVGYEGASYGGTGTPTGNKRAESVLWFNDGSWWAHMWDAATYDFHIFRLDAATQAWVNTKVVTETRSNTHGDVLWDGAHLYVASYQFVNDELAAVSGYPSQLSRFSYDTVTKSYLLDSGFPVLINNMKTETLVIDKDSTGKLWATWQQDDQIYVNTTTGSDLTWGTPFPLAVEGTSVTVDDTSSVVAFGGDKIGIMWSNQSTDRDAMWFAVHQDGDPDSTWTASRTAIQGSSTADDHMNLKSLATDSGGRVYAAIKTSFTSSTQPLIMLLVRDPATGDWASNTIGRVSDCPNRPTVLIDEENRVLHAYYTAPGPPSYGCTSSGGAIHEKTSPLDAISFPVGEGTPVMQDADSPYLHNVSSTKQNVTSRTGIALLAINASTKRYWHSFQALPASAPTTTTTTTTSTTTTSTTTTTAAPTTTTTTTAPTTTTTTAPPPPLAKVPAAPTDLTAAPGNTTAELTWTAPADGGSAITGYRVYRGTSPGSGALVGSPGATATTFSDSGLTNGATYFYRVTAVNEVGEGPYSNEASVTPQSAPSAPLDLRASPAKGKGVALSWTEPTSPGGPITEYRIYRSSTSGAETFLVSVGNVTTYKDTAVTRGSTYFYKVSAVGAGGEGPLSNEAAAKAA